MGWLGSWAKRIKLTLDESQVDAALSNFPVFVSLSTASGIGGIDVSDVFDELLSNSNRKKIAVTTSDGETQCYVEIEKWDDDNEKAALHVKVSSVSDSTDTTLYLYFDSSEADNTTYVGDTGDSPAQSVWDTNFKAVYHMAQDPSGGTDAIKESTANAHQGTSGGSMTSDDLVAGPAAGDGIEFDGNDDYIATGQNDNLKITDEVTVETALYLSAGEPSDHEPVFANGAGVFSEGDRLTFVARRDNSNNYVAYWDNDNSWVESSFSLTRQQWYNVSWVGKSNDYMKFFVDGAQQGNEAITTFPTQEGLLRIAAPYTDEFFKGIVTELRFSNIARAAAWIKATSHSLKDSLITFGSVKEATGYLVADSGTFTITGRDAVLSANPASCAADSGTFIITGFNASLESTLLAEPGIFTITGNKADLHYTADIYVGSGGIKFSGLGYVRSIAVPDGGIKYSGSGYVPPLELPEGGIEYSGSGYVPPIEISTGGVVFSGSGYVPPIELSVGGVKYFGSGYTFAPSVLTGRDGLVFTGTGTFGQPGTVTGKGGIKYSSVLKETAAFILTGSGGLVFTSARVDYAGVLIGSGGIDFSTRPRTPPAPLLFLTGSGAIKYSGVGGKGFALPIYGGIKYSGVGRKPFLDQQDLVRQTWVFSSRFETSIFGDFNFIKLRTFKGKLYGLLPDGLYLIEGTVADNNGVLLKKVDFGGAGRKRIRSIQLGQEYNRLTEIQASVDSGSEYTASYARGRYFLQHAMLGHEFDLKIKNVSSGIDKVVANVVSRS